MKFDVFIVEIKARCQDTDSIRKILQDQSADFRGIDHQVDTYYNVQKGRLKLRKGNIENTLIFYDRLENYGLKESKVQFVRLNKEQVEDMDKLQKTLNGVKTIVDKKREIYFIDNVKFHIDEVDHLGSFIEIEAINSNGEDKPTLEKQCQYYCDLFKIAGEDYISCSYSDMI